MIKTRHCIVQFILTSIFYNTYVSSCSKVQKTRLDGSFSCPLDNLVPLLLLDGLAADLLALLGGDCSFAGNFLVGTLVLLYRVVKVNKHEFSICTYDYKCKY
jgi:hypothetical protein